MSVYSEQARAASSAAPLLPAFTPASSAGPAPPDPDAALTARLGEARMHMLRLAGRAPSGHNAQPWLVSISRDGSRLCVSAARDRRLPMVDPHDRELQISLGCFVETLIQAAPLAGLAAEVTGVADTFDPQEPFVTLRLRPAVTVDDAALETALRDRRTLRKGLRGESIDEAALTRLIGDLPDARFLRLGEPAGRLVAEATVEAARAQVARDGVQRELADWIRWTDEAAARRPTGLTPATMEIDGLAGWWVRHAFGPGTVLTTGFRRAAVRMVARQVREGAGWVVLTAPDDSPAHLLATGRTVARLALRAWRCGIAVHPMSQAVEETRFRRHLDAMVAGPGRTVQMVLRLGRVHHQPRAVGPRLPVSAFARVSG